MLKTKQVGKLRHHIDINNKSTHICQAECEKSTASKRGDIARCLMSRAKDDTWWSNSIADIASAAMWVSNVNCRPICLVALSKLHYIQQIVKYGVIDMIHKIRLASLLSIANEHQAKSHADFILHGLNYSSCSHLMLIRAASTLYKQLSQTKLWSCLKWNQIYRRYQIIK